MRNSIDDTYKKHNYFIGLIVIKKTEFKAKIENISCKCRNTVLRWCIF